MVTLRSKKADNAKDQGQKAEEQPSESRDEEAIEETKEDVVEEPSDAKEELLGAKEKPPDTKANPSNTEEDPSYSREEPSNAKEELSETNEEPSGATSELSGAKAEPSDKKEELSDANEEMSDAKGDPEAKADEQVVEENKEDDEKVEEKEDKEETEERTEIEEEAGNEKENEKEDVTETEGEIETKTEKEIVKESKIDTEKEMETETEMNKEPEPKEKETETSKDTEMEMETEIDKERETGIFGEPEEMDKGDKKEVEAETEMAKEMETDMDKEQEAIDKGKETGIESEKSKEKETETEIYKQPEAIDKEKVTENYKDNETKDKDKEMETKIAKEKETEIDQEMETEIYKKAEAIDKSKESKGKKKKKKKRKNRNRNQVEEKEKSSATVIDDGPEIEYVPEDISIPVGDPSYASFTKIFEAFRLAETITAKDIKQEAKVEKVEVKKIEERDPIFEEEDVDRSEDEPRKSKKKLKRESRLTVAQLKQLVHRPDVVEMHDVNAKDPRLLVYLKAYRNTVPVPRHWCFKRKYLQGKRGFVKPPFELPEFIKNTGIMEMRAAMQEKEDAKTMKSKQRAKVRPKLGKIDIDYQKLHDAFFKYQTKPKMTIHGDLYYEGKEFETKLKEKKPGDLSDDLRTALGMPVGPGKHLIPPPWLIAMQRYGPPPSYPSLKIPGLNAGIPEGASFGYHAGGWGKPPVDETGKPLYGDVFGTLPHEAPIIVEDEDIDRTPWGELESDEESEESEEEEEEEEEDRTGLITPGDAGLITPSGMSSIPAGLETPDIIELRKRKEIEDLMEAGNETPSLFTVLSEKKANVGGASMMGSAHVYDMNAASGRKTTGEGVEIALDPSELELDPAAMSAKYDETIKERDMTKGKEDLSDMVAEHAARKKRKKPTDSGKSAKKYKEFKF